MEYSKIESVVAEVPDFLKNPGKQVGFNGKYFVVGDLCHRAHLRWERPINATPDQEVWQALFCRLIADQAIKRLNGSTSDFVKIDAIIGAPGDLIDSFMSNYPGFLNGRFTVNVPEKNYPLKIEIRNPIFVPECSGHALAYASALKDYCLVISLGFGTVELGAASDQGGAMPETFFSSTFGLHQAVPKWRSELLALGFDNPQVRGNQYHYWDRLLQRVIDRDDSLILHYNNKSWEWRDLHESAVETLTWYGKNLVDHIRPYFSKFDQKMVVVLGGGGIKQHPVVTVLREFLEKMKYKTEEPSPDVAVLAAAIGYRIIAQDHFGKNGMGFEIGNHTSTTVY